VYVGVFSVMRPRPDLTTWLPYRNCISAEGFSHTCEGQVAEEGGRSSCWRRCGGRLCNTGTPRGHAGDMCCDMYSCFWVQDPRTAGDMQKTEACCATQLNKTQQAKRSTASRCVKCPQLEKDGFFTEFQHFGLKTISCLSSRDVTPLQANSLTAHNFASTPFKSCQCNNRLHNKHNTPTKCQTHNTPNNQPCHQPNSHKGIHNWHVQHSE
jgi:hypothetical protein